MEQSLHTIEMTGTVDEDRRLHLDGRLPIVGPRRVRVILLYPNGDELDEQEWMRAAATSPVFADLAAPEEDLYSPHDGRPFHDAV